MSGVTGPLQASSTGASQNRTARLVNVTQQIKVNTRHRQESVLVVMVPGVPHTTDPAAMTPGLQARGRHLVHATREGMNQGAGRVTTSSMSPLNRETAAVTVSQQEAALPGIEPLLEVS